MRCTWSVLLMLMMLSCQLGKGQMEISTAPGVSHELAQFRSKEYLNVKYNLSFEIPANKNEPVMGEAHIFWSQGSKLPLVLDFKGDSSQVISLLMNEVAVDYEVKNEHIYISP